MSAILGPELGSNERLLLGRRRFDNTKAIQDTDQISSTDLENELFRYG
jgi:hypothetical protein